MRFPRHLATRCAASLCWVLLAVAGARAEDAAKDAGDAEGAAKAPASDVVQDGSVVSIEYTLTVEGGETESNVGKEPLTYRQGTGQMLPALEAELAGMKAGATKEVDLTAEQGYGSVRPDLFQTVEISQIPEEARKVGTVLMAQDTSGQQRPVRVQEVKDDSIVLDLNHPLAGKALHFEIKVLSIE
jgi:FKBP-type peptidyl-prolyl cis-trans isomerase SlyD